MDQIMKRAIGAFTYGPETRKEAYKYAKVHEKDSSDEFIEFLAKSYSTLTAADKRRVRTKLIIKQDGKCGICGISQKQLGKTLCIDHDHETDKVRGLLCGNCNSALGMFDCDKYHTDQLVLAIRYLETDK